MSEDQSTSSTPGDPSDESPTIESGRAPSFSGEQSGDSIGPYRLLEVIGEGGFGIVWLAERRDPFVQRVALKIIKAGMDSKTVIARFEQERQALAVMNHPNVARVYDAGTTTSGRPFFVMEHVAGEPITEYCDRHKLTLRERLELFIPVCEAVQHAHHKGIIHRDLKPSNILVGVHGDGAVPKVIDFGVAKAMSHSLTDKTIFTEMGQLIGTPEYMSPEQAEMGATDIDTRTDIYSLGAVLYELLTGAVPFESKSLRSSGYDGIRRIIREQEPPRPSTRVSSLGADSATAVARERQIDGAHLATELKRELDWITLKCLAKDRGRRYDTANGLAMDVRRYLAGEPVLAAPPGAAYRFRKLVRRHRGLFAAIGAVTAVLVIGVVGTSVGLASAVAARNRAREQAARSEQVKAVLTDILRGAGPGVARGRDAALLRDLMDQASRESGKTLENYPQVEAEIRVILGTTLRDIGEYDKAVHELTRAIELYRPMGSKEEGALADATEKLGHLYYLRADWQKAKALFDEAYPMFVRAYGAVSSQVAVNLDYQGQALGGLGEVDESERLLMQALEMKRRTLPADDERIGATLSNIGIILSHRQEFAKAFPYVEEAVRIARVQSEANGVDLASALSNLGDTQRGLGKLVEAQASMEEALALHRKLEGDQAMNVAIDLAKLATVLEDQKEFDAAERDYLQAKDIVTAREGDGHVYVAMLVNNIGLMYFKKGDFAGAERWLRQALERNRKASGPDSTASAQTALNLGKAILGQGRAAQAVPLIRGALAVFLAKEGDAGARTQKARVTLAEAMRRQSARATPEQADALLSEAVILATAAFDQTAGEDADAGRQRIHVQSAGEIIADYEAWHRLRPRRGYDAKAVEWRAKQPS